MYSDSVESDNPSTSYLGQIYDPYFGTTTAEFVTQIRLGSAWDDDYFVIDSIKLYLEFLTVKGAVDKPHYLTLSEICRTDIIQIQPIIQVSLYRLRDLLWPISCSPNLRQIRLTIL